MKKIYMAACIIGMLFGGCVSEPSLCGNPGVQVHTTGNPSFSDEHYVWESWQYGTNRVERSMK